MAMAVKSFNSGIGPECWSTSTVGWDHGWEWQEEEETVKDEPVVVGTPAASFFFSLESSASPAVAAATTTTTKNKSSSTSLKLGRSSPQESLSPPPPPPPPSKKQRPLSPPTTTLVPRCQVENCKADLSGCKDYHKRHKVCEMHSKAPKAIANGIEQRFCQQCSRFHLLKEFDEGKRSCRRRLAGHNERRRKPHPEPHSFFQLSNAGFLHREISSSTLSGVGSPFYSLLPSSPDTKPSSLLHPHRGSFLEFSNTLDSYTSANSFSFKSRNDIIPTFQIQNPKTPMTILKPTSGLDVGGHDQQHRHHYLDHESTTSSLGPLGQGLSLSPSTGRVQVQSLEQSQQQQQQQQSSFHSSSSAAAMDSGRALSLLSLQSWAPSSRPPAPHHDSTTLEHLVASSTSSSHESSNNSNNNCFTVSPSYGAGGGLNLLNGLTATGSSGTHQHINNIDSNNMLSSLGGYDTSSMLALLQGGGHSSLGLTTMDLINHGGYNSGSSFSSVRAFESSRFGHQQQLL